MEYIFKDLVDSEYNLSKEPSSFKTGTMMLIE
ncbi:uncharacterized protein METZ01_LOCUS138814 [marine metagenome]|uniref:Uncharacterized protein n=1 Tax=marine metagenome TaxID=408172 RepID=A0A381Z9Q3_9ZZZZ